VTAILFLKTKWIFALVSLFIIRFLWNLVLKIYTRFCRVFVRFVKIGEAKAVFLLRKWVHEILPEFATFCTAFHKIWSEQISINIYPVILRFVKILVVKSPILRKYVNELLPPTFMLSGRYVQCGIRYLFYIYRCSAFGSIMKIGAGKDVLFSL